MGEILGFFASHLEISKGAAAGPFFILISAAIALVTAWLTIYFNRKTARQNASINLIMELETNDRLRDGNKTLREYHYDPQKSTEQLVFPDGEECETHSQHVKDLLNFYENMAIGIRVGIYDKKTISLSRRSQILDTFETAEPLIKKARKGNQKTAKQGERIVEGNPCLYENFEWLYNCIKENSSILCFINSLGDCFSSDEKTK